MKTKFNAYSKFLTEFINDIYVVCPKCENQAIVKSNGFSYSETNEAKLICPTCGLNKHFSESSNDVLISERRGIKIETPYLILGASIDPYFKLPLWLQKEMPDGLLWAYNYEHLTFLENHIGAEIRNRETSPMRNKSLGSRLPKWMTSKKNRTEILNGINKLKQK